MILSVFTKMCLNYVSCYYMNDLLATVVTICKETYLIECFVTVNKRKHLGFSHLVMVMQEGATNSKGEQRVKIEKNEEWL